MVNGKPINEQARRAVAAAIADLGQPDRPVGASRAVEVVDAAPTAVVPAADELVPRRVEPSPVASEAPADVAAALLQAVRAELGPMDARMQELTSALNELVHAFNDERRMRMDDFEVLADLAIDGWRGVDRRLGRVEKTLARIDDIENENAARRERTVKRLEDWIQERPRS